MRKEDFDERTFTALNWVRTYLLFEGDFPDRDVDDVFRRAYPIDEQKAVFATLKLMLFFNMLLNVFDRRGSRLLKRQGGLPGATGRGSPEETIDAG